MACSNTSITIILIHWRKYGKNLLKVDTSLPTHITENLINIVCNINLAHHSFYHRYVRSKTNIVPYRSRIRLDRLDLVGFMFDISLCMKEECMFLCDLITSYHLGGEKNTLIFR